MSGRIIITYTGAAPAIVIEPDNAFPTPLPPPPPPVPPAPPADDRPFDWPPEYFAPTDTAARAAWVWLVPGRTEWDLNGKVYAFLSQTGNPVGILHHNAGIISAGRFQGCRLWAPYDAPGAFLRAILAGFV